MTKGRYVTVSSSDEVGRLFGLDSEVYAASKMAFGANNPPSKIMVGLWNKAGTSQPETANAIQATRAPTMLINFAQLFNFTIKANEVEETVNLDLSSTTLADHAAVVTALNTALGESSAFEFALVDGKYVLQATLAGADTSTDNIEIITNFGRNIADLTRLSSSYNPIVVQGHDAITGTPESLAKALMSITELTQ